MPSDLREKQGSVVKTETEVQKLSGGMMMLKVDLNAPTLNGVAPSQDNSKAEPASADSLTTPDQDKATLSTDRTRIEGLTNQAMASAAMRQEIVNALRQAIRSGDYRMESGQTADALIQDAG